MEYNPFHHHQDQTNSEALHAQEFTHMNNIVFLPDLKKKKKKKLTHRPSQFSGQKGKPTFYFLGLILSLKIWKLFQVLQDHILFRWTL